MAANVGWSEAEVRAAVTAYFKLLKAEQAEKHVNKMALYRELTAQFPKRPPKAFELKFQNISAILYEERLPYCSGLKPRFNYQRLLRLIVLDHLHRTPLPAVEPHEILFAKLKELCKRGPIPVIGKGSGRFGLAMEEALGIPQNSAKDADFMGIELKTKSDGSLQTLFSRTPSRFVQDADKQAMFARHRYLDRKRRRHALYTSFSESPDSLGFRLAVRGQVIQVLRRRAKILEYDAERLEEALLSKHTHTAFIALERGKHKGKEVCTLKGVQYCKWPSIIRFLRLVRSGNIFLDFTMSGNRKGKVTDHGFLWKIRGSALDQLYLYSTTLDLNEV